MRKSMKNAKNVQNHYKENEGPILPANRNPVKLKVVAMAEN